MKKTLLNLLYLSVLGRENKRTNVDLQLLDTYIEELITRLDKVHDFDQILIQPK
jgi:hypothetical protein